MSQQNAAEEILRDKPDTYNVQVRECVCMYILYRREGVGVSDSGVVSGGVQGVVPVHPRMAQVL